MEKIIFEKVNRGVTKWNAYGAYRNEEREILMTVVSKSEFLQLRRLLLAADPEVFIIIEENVLLLVIFKSVSINKRSSCFAGAFSFTILFGDDITNTI